MIPFLPAAAAAVRRVALLPTRSVTTCSKPQRHVAALLVTLPADPARPAAPPAPDGDGVAALDALDVWSDGFDVSRVLVPQGQRQLEAGRQRKLAGPDVQVGMAHTSAGDPDQHFVSSNLGHGHLVDSQRLSEGVESRCPHGCPPPAAISMMVPSQRSGPRTS